MQNARLDNSQAGINIAGNINNLRYVDDTILTAESEEERKSLLIRCQGTFNFKGSNMLHFPLCAISQALSVPYQFLSYLFV